MGPSPGLALCCVGVISDLGWSQERDRARYSSIPNFRKARRFSDIERALYGVKNMKKCTILIFKGQSASAASAETVVARRGPRLPPGGSRLGVLERVGG